MDWLALMDALMFWFAGDKDSSVRMRRSDLRDQRGTESKEWLVGLLNECIRANCTYSHLQVATCSYCK